MSINKTYRSSRSTHTHTLGAPCARARAAQPRLRPAVSMMLAANHARPRMPQPTAQVRAARAVEADTKTASTKKSAAFSRISPPRGVGGADDIRNRRPLGLNCSETTEKRPTYDRSATVSGRRVSKQQGRERT